MSNSERFFNFECTTMPMIYNILTQSIQELFQLISKISCIWTFSDTLETPLLRISKYISTEICCNLKIQYGLKIKAKVIFRFYIEIISSD